MIERILWTGTMQQGLEAYHRGAPLIANPYAGTEQATGWAVGWMTAESEARIIEQGLLRAQERFSSVPAGYCR